MSDKATSAGNQQGSRLAISEIDPSETTRRAPFSKKAIVAYLLGALHDATLNKRRVRFSQKGVEWLEFLKFLLVKTGYNSWIYKEGKTRSVYVLETLASFLDFKLNPLNLKTQEEQICYLRGFFDAEGGIPKNNGRFYIQLVQSDRIKLRRIKIILGRLGITTGKIHNPSKRVDPNYWRMYVLVNSQKEFALTVGSWHPRKQVIFIKRMKI